MNIKNIVYALVAILILSCSKDDEPKLNPAKFSIDQSTVDFGEVEITTLKEIKLTITNTGDEDLVLKDYSFSGSNASEFSFNASETEEKVEAGKTYSFLIIFKPVEAGDKTAILTITSNVGEHKVNVSGKSYDPNALVNIPDANFKAKLLSQIQSGGTVGGYRTDKIDTNDDGEIQVSEARAFEGAIIYIGTSNANISNLTGIEAFVNLKALWLRGTEVTNLDLSNNIALKMLFVEDGKLTGLNVLNCTDLEELSCYNNELSGLDISKNTSLKRLFCYDNQLSSLDVSKNSDLERLICNGNQLSSLDLSNNTSLYQLRVQDNQLTNLDVSKNTALKELNCNNNQLTSLDISNTITLENLYCLGNKLTDLDVTQSTALRELICATNQLTSLDVSNNTTLIYLSCIHNQLSSLDISGNGNLRSLFCYNNQLTSLNVSNGINASIIQMQAQNNPDLTCIQKDAGFTPPNDGSWKKDDTASYSSGCF